MITESMQLSSQTDANVWAEQLGYDGEDTARIASWIWSVKPSAGCTYAEHPLSAVGDDDTAFWAAVDAQ